jgi:hypothetical protein
MGTLTVSEREAQTPSPASQLNFPSHSPSVAVTGTQDDGGGLADRGLATVPEAEGVAEGVERSPLTHTPRGARTAKKGKQKAPTPPPSSSSEPDDSGGSDDDDDEDDAGSRCRGEGDGARRTKSKVREKAKQGKKDQTGLKLKKHVPEKKEKKRKEKKGGGSSDSSSSDSSGDDSSSNGDDSDGDDGDDSDDSSSDDDDEDDARKIKAKVSGGGGRRRERRTQESKLLQRLQAEMDQRRARDIESDGKLPKWHGKGMGGFDNHATLDGNKKSRITHPLHPRQVIEANY